MIATKLDAESLGIKVDSSGDARIWLAPLRDDADTATVLRFTTTNGTQFSVRLTDDDVARITADARAVAESTEAGRQQILDHAAHAIREAADTGTLPAIDRDGALAVRFFDPPP
ncbi:MAG: hypothetical protein QG671_1942 [Actinomycetota bacterium]|nr:hypothetical protein [Actinomycetota bacterium]